MTMIQISQIIISLSVLFVWLFRYKNIQKEFKLFGLGPHTLMTVRITKVIISILLIIGIWIPQTTTLSSISMSIFMISAQYFHWKANNPIIKKYHLSYYYHSVYS